MVKPSVKVVVGRYDLSLARNAYMGMNVDYIVRGEGGVAFRELLRALEQAFLVDIVPVMGCVSGFCTLCKPDLSPAVLAKTIRNATPKTRLW